MNIHILGICGTLMGSIALLAREMGHEVTGSDQNVFPPMSTQLQSAGIPLIEGYHADTIPENTELVIVGNAGLPRGNPALEAVLNKGIAYTSGAEWLGRYLLADRWVIAVAGTHGKTTTTAMISWILDYAGLDPGFLIGGIPQNFSLSSRLGTTPFFVIEADEYDTSYFDRRSKFLHYRPRTLVMNNLEYDHADIFPDLDAIKSQFHLLLRSVPGEGLVVYPSTDANLGDVISKGCWTPTLALGSINFHAISDNKDGSAFSVIIDGENKGQVCWSLTGQHNVMNGLSAIAAARHIGVTPEVSCEALAKFEGVKRRMELIYAEGNIHVYDDFAHHPTEISTTLDGLRKKVGDEKILAVIEPASHTMRRGVHESSLGASSSAANQTIWFQPGNVDWDMSTLSGKQSLTVDTPDKLFKNVYARATQSVEPLHIVIMSNGSFGGFHKKLVDALSGQS